MFQQQPPSLGNQYEDDRVLRSYLARVLPESMLSEIEPSLIELGRLAGGELYQMQLADRLNEPKLTHWDAWGNRIDKVEVTSLWREAERIAVEHGLVATAYEQRHGSLSRVHQCALAYLFTPSTDIYSCPLAMTDGAARTLLDSGNQELIDHVVPHLISRNPANFWTAGQWMTELTGGSDVGLSETIARQEISRETGEKGNGETQHSQLETATQEGMSQGQEGGHAPAPISEPQFAWRLYGNKWFTSAITSQIALTLARPEGNPPGGRGLALFYVELRDEHGRCRNIRINRLKDKLGTRKVPTAELTLVGTPAQLVKGPSDGVRNIAPLLNITRLWNGISAVSLMRRGLALALDYARKRIAFGETLSKKPLHMDTLAGLQAEAEAAFHLAFYVAELTGRAETAATKSPMSNVQRPTSDDQSHTRTASGSDRVEASTVSATNNRVEGSPASTVRDSGRVITGINETRAFDEDEALLLRLLTPVMKLTTGKQAVMVLSEVIEAFGGAGYVEDTGLPQLLRDAQVLPIWEGTTNVLSLDTLRALKRPTSNVQSPTSDNKTPLRTESDSNQVAVTQVGMPHGQEGGHAPAPIRTASGSDRAAVSQLGMSQGQEGGHAPAPIRTGSGSNQVGVSQLGMSQGQEGGHAPAPIRTASGSDRSVTQVGMSQGQEGGHAPAHDGNDPTCSIQSQLNTGSAGVSSAPFQAFKSAVSNCLSEAHDSRLTDPVRTTQSALAHTEAWLAQTTEDNLEAGARRFAMTLGRTLELALLIRQAQWSQDHEADGRATAAARRFANSGIDLLVDHSLDDVSALFPGT